MLVGLIGAEGQLKMKLSLKTVIDAAVIMCFSISFISFKFIPTKHHIIFQADNKDIKLLKIGSIFFGIGLFLLATRLVFEIVH
jgi:hypothetical protein